MLPECAPFSPHLCIVDSTTAARRSEQKQSFMQTTSASANKVGNNTVNNSANTAKSATAKAQRVVETRDAWSVIFNHTVALVVKAYNGEAISYETDRKGFGFLKVAEQPHSRAYAKALLAGFVSRKANKVLGDVVGLQSIEERTKIAIAILVATKLETSSEKAKSFLGKAEPKQAKTFSEAVLNKVQNTELPKSAKQTESAPCDGGKCEDAQDADNRPKVGGCGFDHESAVKATLKSLGLKANGKGKRQLPKEVVTELADLAEDDNLSDERDEDTGAYGIVCEDYLRKIAATYGLSEYYVFRAFLDMEYWSLPTEEAVAKYMAEHTSKGTQKA